MKLFKVVKWIPDHKSKTDAQLEVSEFIAAKNIETVFDSLKLDFLDENTDVVSIALAAERVITLSEKTERRK